MLEQSISFRLVVLVALMQCCVLGYAQTARNPGIKLATIDADTRWTLRSLDLVSISSPIVRLGDVAVPLDPNMVGWQRIRRLTIGLVPLDGQPMTIDRDRLTDAIRNCEATPKGIDWVGSRKIVVEYKPHAKQDDGVAVTGYDSIKDQVVFGDRSPKNRSVNTSPVNLLSESEKNRALQWIRRGITTFQPNVFEGYSFDVDPAQFELAKLTSLAAVTGFEVLGMVQEGEVPCRISARGVSGPVTVGFRLLLTSHPRIVVPRVSLSRGQRIEASDLEMQPIQADLLKSEYVSDLEEVVGMEAKSPLSANRPIRRDRLRAPVAIHRGELIEVQVVGGGITVSTKGKAISDGAVSELIEIETSQPRKRLLGRVVDVGLVEIITRAPSVRR